MTATTPPWGTPSKTPSLKADQPAAPETWELRQEVDGSSGRTFLSRELEVVVGTEQQAMARLMELALEMAKTIKPSKGYKIAQDGTTLIVSPAKLDWGQPLLPDTRFTAVRIVTTVPPVSKKPNR